MNKGRHESSPNSFVQYILTLLLTYLLGTILFIVGFHTPLFQSMNVFMYRGIVLLLLSAVLMVPVMLLLKHHRFFTLTGKDIFSIFLVYCSINLVFFTLIPVTVERSVSVFMLCSMSEDEDQTMTKDEIEDTFSEKYVSEYGAFDKRFEEQITTGTILYEGNGYQLTSRGETLVTMFRLIGKLFDTDQRLLYPN